MPRITHHSWYCVNSHKNSPADRKCVVCGTNHVERYAQVGMAERAVVYYNPATGEHRTPPRADMMMPESYAKQGFERKEILSMTAWEKEAGVVHEPSNFNSGNETFTNDPPLLKKDPKLMHELAKDMADAIASGPFTGGEGLL